MKHFVLYNPRFSNTPFAYGEERNIDFNTGDAEYCKECGNPLSMLEWLPPYDISISKKKTGDLIFGTFVGFLTSQKFKEEYEKSNLRGLKNFRITELYYKSKKLDIEYYYPDISLINAFIDLSKTDMRKENTCKICQKGGNIINQINGIIFLNPENIKEDIFFTASLGQADIIISENFKDFLEKNNFSNTKLIEASKYRWDSMNP